MRYRGTTRKQARYAHNIMNTNLSRGEAMRASGYSESSSEHPARIENTDGFKLAMAKQAFEAGNIASGIMHEIQVRGFKEYDPKQLFNALDVISKAFERFTPKESKATNGVRSVFANVIDVTPDVQEVVKNDTKTDDTVVNGAIDIK